MIRPLHLLVVCLLLSQPARIYGDSSGWKVGSWNLQNFLIDNRFENGRFLYAYPMPEQRKRQIREHILRHRPDILFLQEIGSSAFLVELQRDLSTEGLHYPYYHFSGFEDARSGLAFLSRTAPDEVVFHDLSLRRGVQEVRFLIGEDCFRFFHVHLKSRYSEDASDPQAVIIRSREISLLTEFVDRSFAAVSGQHFLILGDFNTPFEDDLLLPLKDNWTHLHMADTKANPYTYFHHSGNAEILDGFWFHNSASFFPSGLLYPLPQDCPSDHRFLMLYLLSGH